MMSELKEGNRRWPWASLLIPMAHVLSPTASENPHEVGKTWIPVWFYQKRKINNKKINMFKVTSCILGIQLSLLISSLVFWYSLNYSLSHFNCYLKLYWQVHIPQSVFSGGDGEWQPTYHPLCFRMKCDFYVTIAIYVCYKNALQSENATNKLGNED